MIRVVDLHKSFDGRPVLKGLSLEVPPAQITAVIGRSGSGKSVLFRQMVGLSRPDSGAVLVAGEDIARLRGRALLRARARFGFLFQSGALFDSMTVFDNVAFPLREKTRAGELEVGERVRQQLAVVGLEEIADRFPAELSGGMKRRVALARALVLDPEIVLFDEPTTGLDPILLHSVQRSIAAAQRRLGFTAVVVSHDIPEIFEIAQTVAMLHDGAIVEQGSPEEIQASTNPTVRHFIQGIGE